MEEIFGRYFISIFLILLFSIRLSLQRSEKDKELRYFWMTVICCALLVAEDLLETLCAENPDLRFWRMTLSIAGYVLRSVAAASLVFTVLKPERRTRSVWIPCILILLVCCTAYFSDIVFGFDEDYAFYRGPLGYIVFVVPLMYLGAILWLTFKHYGDSVQKTEPVILIICALLCLFSAILDAVHGGVRLHEAILISSIFFYLFLRNYDIRRDSLTQLLNRQSLYEDCAGMGRSITAMASVDMNGLKLLNDREGYPVGDAALRRIGQCLGEVTGPKVRAYRIGGDEFVLLFRNTDEETVRETLERIHDSVKESGYSVAYGYAMREEKEKTNALLARSDMKMFENKAHYYRERMHDRRRDKRDPDTEYPDEMRNALEDSPQPVAVYRFGDHRMDTVAVSDGFCKLFGYPNREQAAFILDNDTFKDVHPDDRERVSGAMFRFSEGQEELDVVYRTKAVADPGYRVIHARGMHEHTETGTQTAYDWYMDEGPYVEDEESGGTQISQALNRALHEESIIHAAHYDELTGLPNLTYFFKLSDAAKAHNGLKGEQGVLLYIDLYGMKYFNRTNGFAEGDRLLKAFAGVLTNIFGKMNCCHVSADRFAAGAREENIVERLRQLFTDAEKMNDGKTLPVRVGIYSSSVEDVPASTAYDRAKMACDVIRRSETSAFYYYNAELRDAVKRSQYLIMNLDKAIRERWIQVYYQPIVRAVNGKVCEEEALARWIDPVEGFLSPAEFIPQLEEAGLIYKLDLCVLEQVLEKMKGQEGPEMHVVPHSLNLSRSDFDSCDIVEEIRKRVDEAGIRREMIAVEITESVVGRDSEFMEKQIERFRSLGFKVWMDDFGSGYSSLDVLQSIPFDLIKFDMSFTRKLDEGETGKIILTELMKMATTLGVDTICEGVETEAQARFLQEIGCSKLQGFYFCKPLSFEALRERYRNGEQIGFEDPETSEYFESIGRVNLYELDMIAEQPGDGTFRNAFDTLPMAIMEIQGEKARYARTNPSYRAFAKRMFNFDVTAVGKEYKKFNAPFMDYIIRTCCGLGMRTFYDEKMPDGSTVHSFARKISENPKTGTTAVAIAVLSVSEPNDEESYADIARALASDYYNIYIVDLDSEEFIEYTSQENRDELAVERHGTHFFTTVRRDTQKRIFADDREMFLTWFTKENIIKELDEHGVFNTTYRITDSGNPEYVTMKATRMRQTNRVIFGVSIVDMEIKQQAMFENVLKERDGLARIMAIAEDYIGLYSVDPETGNYKEYTATADFEALGYAREGEDFFADGAENGKIAVYPEDLPKYLEGLTKEKVLSGIAENGNYSLNYRLMYQGKPTFVSLKFTPFEDGKGSQLLAGVRKWRERK